MVADIPSCVLIIYSIYVIMPKFKVGDLVRVKQQKFNFYHYQSHDIFVIVRSIHPYEYYICRSACPDLPDQVYHGSEIDSLESAYELE